MILTSIDSLNNHTVHPRDFPFNSFRNYFSFKKYTTEEINLWCYIFYVIISICVLLQSIYYMQVHKNKYTHYIFMHVYLNIVLRSLHALKLMHT